MPRITPVHWKVFEKVFLTAGFQFARQEGSHRYLYKTWDFQAHCDSYVQRDPRIDYQEQP
jgi:hypothetical protein